MLTLADVQNNWVGLHRILLQPEFDPVVMEFTTKAKGWPYDHVSKHTFIDIVSIFIQLATHPADRPVEYLKLTDNGAVHEIGVQTEEYCRRLPDFILRTSYCDKLLVRYRITCHRMFSDFAVNCLRSWSKGATFRYEMYYSPIAMERRLAAGETDEPLSRANFLESAIIEKTNSLLRERKHGNRQF